MWRCLVLAFVLFGRLESELMELLEIWSYKFPVLQVG